MSEEPSSFPFFRIAKKYGVSYSDVLKYADRAERWNIIIPERTGWPARPLEISSVVGLTEAILEAVDVEQERRLEIMENIPVFFPEQFTQ